MNWKTIYRHSFSLQKPPSRFFIFATHKLWNYLVQVFLVGFSSFLLSYPTILVYCLSCKSIFHLSEHHKFESFLQPWWDIQVCEKIEFMERWKRNGLYRNIRRPLHKAWFENWLIWNWKKSLPCGKIDLNVYMFRNDMKFISG